MDRRNALGVHLRPRSAHAPTGDTDNVAIVDDLVLWLAETFILEDLDIQSDGPANLVLEATIRIPDVAGDPSSG